MNITKEARYLLDRYMLAFTRKIPISSRKDIVTELRSSIYDTLEGSYGDTLIEEPQMESLLNDLGAPGALAGSYNQDQRLIGSDIFPFFRMVVLIVWTVLSVIALIQIGMALTMGDPKGILMQFAQLFSSLTSSLGAMVIAFYLLQRFGKHIDWNKEIYEDWTIRDLPEIDRREPIKRWEQIVTICFTIIFIAVVNLFAHRIGIYYSIGEGYQFIPILKEGFYQILPVISVRWAFTAVVAAILLIHREERLGTSIFIIILSCVDIAIAAVFLKRGLDTFFDFEVLNEPAVEALNPLKALTPMFKGLVTALFILIIALTVYEIIKKIIEIVKYPAEV
ncbi:MAG: hypothetical protein K9M84_11480 [Spirochaetia bacterium]|nr:hypothetical protein [Spirochaetia bacterium]MCF7942228.1 hypothetical protein [Spirochaetia bacterium]